MKTVSTKLFFILTHPCSLCHSYITSKFPVLTISIRNFSTNVIFLLIFFFVFFFFINFTPDSRSHVKSVHQHTCMLSYTISLTTMPS